MKPAFCIIVTYNGMQWIDKCLKSVLCSTYPVTPIVVDNASTDETVSFIKINYPGVHLILEQKNRGFGQANNSGLRWGLDQGGQYFFLLNQDAWIENSTISILIHSHEQSPEFGIISPLHFNGTGTTFDKYFERYLLHSNVPESVLPSIMDNSFPPRMINTNFVNAAAWLVTRECLLKAGGFDPIFFHYGEDLNFCQRTLAKGYHIGIYTGAKIYHDREQRIKRAAPTTKELIKRDYIQFLNQVCDIRQKQYRNIILKRAARYSFYALMALVQLDRPAFNYNFGMAKLVCSSFLKINKSRATSGLPGITPYL